MNIDCSGVGAIYIHTMFKVGPIYLGNKRYSDDYKDYISKA